MIITIFKGQKFHFFDNFYDINNILKTNRSIFANFL